jgi:ribosome maturation factor RimP
MEASKRIRALLNDLFASGTLADCYVIDVEQHGSQSLTIYIDSDSGVTFDKCTQVSRYLEKHLEEEGLVSGDYVLDVSSPGVERPLMLWRQYPKHKGRDLLVTLKDGNVVEGKLTEVNMDSLQFETEKTQTVEIPFSDIDKSIVQIRF